MIVPVIFYKPLGGPIFSGFFEVLAARHLMDRRDNREFTEDSFVGAMHQINQKKRLEINQWVKK